MKWSITLMFLAWYSGADAQNWDTYMAKFGNKPGSVLVDMDLINRAPDSRYPYVVITGPQARNCDDDGMPAKQEISALEDILTATGNFITGVTPQVLAGTLTYNCERLNYYYVKDTIGIRNAMQRLYDRSYGNYSFAVNMKYDPAWNTYKTFLYPGEEMQNWMANTKTIAQMLKDGDSLAVPHNINFQFFFDTDTGRKAFGAWATAHGYTTGRENQTRKPPISYGLLLVKKSKIDLDDMNKTTTELTEEVKKHHGIYGGWYATRLVE